MAGGRMYAGNPDTVYRQIMDFYRKVAGFGHLIMVGKTGFITHDEATKNITLFAKEVLPWLGEVKPVVVEWPWG
jgi:alkanesulfonate monooxygenase SsuD/methylene tetrahydromethanopterin reductase-like flavin-dependent oxidoreductase (luciferase family)